MGSSTKKKKEKQKDFQKPKLKVGKVKPKASNFTDTSFRSKAIVVAHQSLSENAPDPVTQFRHNLSLASTSRSDSQRRDALAYLTTQISAGNRSSSSNNNNNNPIGTAALLNKLLPLISDPAGPVRTQLLKLFHALPPAEVRPVVGTILLHVRAGITHLSSAVRDDALGVLEWLVDVAGEDLVACPGGWLKTLNGFGAMMGLVAADDKGAAGSGWSAAPKASFAAVGTANKNGGGGGGSRSAPGRQAYARQMAALAKFLTIGLRSEPPAPYSPQAFWHNLYGAPFSPSSCQLQQAGPFDHLNLFGPARDEDGEIYDDREDRQRMFARRWQVAISRTIDDARKEGGAVGRAAVALEKAVKEGMGDFDVAVVG